MLSICFPVITFIAVDVEKKFTMILLVFVAKKAFLASLGYINSNSRSPCPGMQMSCIISKVA